MKKSTLLLTVLVVAATAAAPAASEPQVATETLQLKVTFRRRLGSHLVSRLKRASRGASVAHASSRAIPSGASESLTDTYTWRIGRWAADLCNQLRPRRSQPPANSSFQGGAITLHARRGSTVRWVSSRPSRSPGRTSRRNSPSPAAQACSRRHRGAGGLEARAFSGGAGDRDLCRGRSRCRATPFDLTAPTLSGATAKTVRVPKKGAKNARVTFKVTATDDVDGHRARLVSAEVGQPLQGWPDDGALRGDRLEQQHGQGRARGHGEAAALINNAGMRWTALFA